MVRNAVHNVFLNTLTMETAFSRVPPSKWPLNCSWPTGCKGEFIRFLCSVVEKRSNWNAAVDWRRCHICISFVVSFVSTWAVSHTTHVHFTPNKPHSNYSPLFQCFYKVADWGGHWRQGCRQILPGEVYRVPQKVSHYKVSSLNRIKTVT